MVHAVFFCHTFDLREEVYNVIPVPDVWLLKIFSWKTSLALLGHNGNNYEVWVMNHEDQASATIMPWTKLFVYDYQQQEKCSGAWKDDFIFTRNLTAELLLYDPTSQKVRKLSIIPKHDLYYYHNFSSFNYVESLVSV